MLEILTSQTTTAEHFLIFTLAGRPAGKERALPWLRARLPIVLNVKDEYLGVQPSF